MANTPFNISLPEDLKEEMAKFEDVNWSLEAARAFRLIVKKHKTVNEICDIASKAGFVINQLQMSRVDEPVKAPELKRNYGIPE